MIAGTLLDVLDLAGVAVFAATGALAASRKQLDLIGFVFMAAITGVGGGTLRDILLGQTPVFWVTDGRPIILCAAVAGLVYLFGAHLESRYKALLWADAVGIAAFTIVGAAKALALDSGIVAAIVMGMMTGTFGGILRDVVAGEQSVVMRREIYLTAALFGAAVFVLLSTLMIDRAIAAGSGATAAFLLRAGALHFGWALPVYKSRPPRDRS